MHIMWFTSSTKGLLKRRAAARLLLLQSISTPTVSALEEDTEVAIELGLEQNPNEPSTIPSPPSPYLLPARSDKLVALASSYLNSSSRRISNLRSRRTQILTSTTDNSTNFDFLVRDYFTLPRIPTGVEIVGDENVRALAAGLGSTKEMMLNLKMRAGQVKRAGGRLRRRVGGMVAAL